MNKYNATMLQHVQKAGECMTHLNRMGCAIVSISIGDTGRIIDILPPPRGNKLTGNDIAIVGTTNGREYHNQCRFHGCIVRWKANSEKQ